MTRTNELPLQIEEERPSIESFIGERANQATVKDTLGTIGHNSKEALSDARFVTF